jgi:hypothetical protein
MRIHFATASFLLLASSACAQSLQTKSTNDSVSLFGGRFTNQYFENSLVPFASTYEDNFLVGGFYQHFFLGNDGGLRLGVEAGAAMRIAGEQSVELWGGGVARYEGLHLGGINLVPAVTVGVSLETAPVGIEVARAQEMGGDPTALFYLAPEIAMSSSDNPNVEFFYRVHHRSGAWGTLGEMRDGANAQVIGIRTRF